jgi:hypothetical protein
MSDRDPEKFKQVLADSGLAEHYTAREQELLWQGWLYHVAVVEKRDADLLATKLTGMH